MVVVDISTPTPNITGQLPTPNQLTYALSTTKDSRSLFSCCSDGSVNMWDLRTLSLVKNFVGHEDSVTCCCLTPDGQKLITGSLDKSVRVWDIAEGKEHCKYMFGAQIFSLGVCPMEPIIAVGLETSIIDVRYLSNFDLNQELTAHESCVLGLKYSPSGSWFVTSGKDHKLVVWRSINCEMLFQQVEGASILSCDVSRDGRFIVTGSGEQNAHVYEVMY
jgi:WD40 repeat protein